MTWFSCCISLPSPLVFRFCSLVPQHPHFLWRTHRVCGFRGFRGLRTYNPSALPGKLFLLVVSSLLFSHLGPNLSPFWKYNIDAPRGFSGSGLYCAHLFPACSQVSHLKSVMAEVFTPEKLANTTKECFPPREPVVLNILLPVSPPCSCLTHAFSHFLHSIYPSKVIFSMCCFLLTLSFRYNPKGTQTFSKLLLATPWTLRSVCVRTFKLRFERTKCTFLISYAPKYLKF